MASSSGLLNGLARSDIFLSFWETTAGMREAARPFVQAAARNITAAAAQVVDRLQAVPDNLRFAAHAAEDSIASIRRNLCRPRRTRCRCGGICPGSAGARCSRRVWRSS